MYSGVPHVSSCIMATQPASKLQICAMRGRDYAKDVLTSKPPRIVLQDAWFERLILQKFAADRCVPRAVVGLSGCVRPGSIRRRCDRSGAFVWTRSERARARRVGKSDRVLWTGPESAARVSGSWVSARQRARFARTFARSGSCVSSSHLLQEKLGDATLRAWRLVDAAKSWQGCRTVFPASARDR